MHKLSQFLIPCAFFLSALPSYSQSPVKWGKIPEEDLKMTLYQPDTAATAVVLGDFGIAYFDFDQSETEVVLDRHRRIKILKRAGFDYADIGIVYQSGNRYQNVSNLKAQIVQPDGSKRALERKEFFEEKVDENFTRIKFSFPEVKEGSVIEYSYSLRSSGVFQLPEWYFQGEIPVRWSEYVIQMPEFYQYVTLRNGPKFAIDESTPTSIVVSGQSVEGYTYRMACKDLPGLSEESFITTMDDYLSRVRLQLSEVKRSGVFEPVLKDWKALASELLENGSLGKVFNQKNDFSEAFAKVAPLVGTGKSKQETLQIVYDFVLGEMNWNGRNGIFASQSLNKCFQEKSGTAADLNLLLIGLLRQFDIPAVPLILGTRDFGKVVDLYPIVDQFNYLMAMVELDGKSYFLDATNSYRPIGLPSINALNEKAWKVDKDNPAWVAVAPPKAQVVRAFNLTITENGELAGELSASYDGYAGVDIREELSSGDETNESSDAEVSATEAEIVYDSVALTNKNDISKPLVYKASVRIPEALTDGGERVYLPSVLQPTFDENPFKLTTRQYPVDIPYPITHRYVLTLKIPEQYEVEQLPQPVIVTIPNNGGKFSFAVQKNAPKMIQIVSSIQLNQLHFEPEEYPFVKQFFDMLIEKQQEQIVLKKL